MFQACTLSSHFLVLENDPDVFDTIKLYPGIAAGALFFMFFGFYFPDVRSISFYYYYILIF